MKFCRDAECLVIQFFAFGCASRDPTLTHVDLSSGFSSAGARQEELLRDVIIPLRFFGGLQALFYV